jgi:hypothetical protein
LFFHRELFENPFSTIFTNADNFVDFVLKYPLLFLYLGSLLLK